MASSPSKTKAKKTKRSRDPNENAKQPPKLPAAKKAKIAAKNPDDDVDSEASGEGGVDLHIDQAGEMDEPEDNRKHKFRWTQFEIQAPELIGKSYILEDTLLF
jgi:hypothetical protein